MRHWNKLLALLMAMVMALGMTATAFADDDEDSKGGSTTPTSIEADAGETDKKEEDGGDEADKKEEDGEDEADKKEEDGEDEADKKEEDGEDEADKKEEDGEDEADKKEEDGEDEADKKEDGDAAPAAMNYTDVSESNWFHGAVAFVTENKLIDGMTGTTFGPSEKMTRQMLAVALYRLAGSPEVTIENPFTDVAAGAAYKDAVVWAYSVGVVNGETAATFNPDGTIERQAIAAMLARYIGADTSKEVDLSKFSDAGEIRSYAKGALSWAVENDLIKGNDKGGVNPRGDASRAEVATILQRFAPMAEKAPSTEGDAAPAEGDAAPAEGDAAPAEGDAAPAGGEADAAEGDTTPAEGDAGSTESGDAASDKDTTPETEKAE